MGFVLKSVFWLGLVYSAMPLGELSTAELGAIACDAATKQVPTTLPAADSLYRQTAFSGCMAALRGQLVDSARSEISKPTHAAVAHSSISRQSLTDADRRPTWVGQNVAPMARQRRGG